MSLWPVWLRPEWLALIPLMAVLLFKWWRLEKRSGRWQLLLPPQFQTVLLSAGRRQQSRLPWLALALAWLLALGALLGPSWQRLEQISQKRSDPLVVALELSPNMLAADLAPNRLEQAKRKIRDLLKARFDGQTAIIVYAGSAHVLVPLSDDANTTHNLLDALKPSIMPRSGQRADLAVIKAQELLQQGAQGKGKILLVTSGLTEQEQQGISQALSKRTSELNLLGVGSEQGAPIRHEDGSLSKDADGAIIIPKLNSTQLSRFADREGAQYQKLQLNDTDLDQLGLLKSSTQTREAGEATLLDAWADQGHWLLLPLILIAACAARRGWLLALCLFVVLPQPSYAFSWSDLWWRPDQQGQRLLEQNRPLEAAKRFADPQWQGEALYLGGDYSGAAERFTLSDSAAAHYNRGNALAQMQAYEAALDAYDQALERQPDLQPALANKALIEELLRQQEEQQAQQPSDETSTHHRSESGVDNDATEQSQPSSPTTSQSTTADTDSQNTPEAPSESASSDQQKPNQAERTDQSNTSAENAEENVQTPGAPSTGQANDANESLVSPIQAGTDLGNFDDEQRAAMEQWLRQIPDDPGELLRRKFLLEQRLQQEHLP